MAKFIKLHDMAKSEVFVNADQIVRFNSNHHLGEGWQFTHITHNYGYIDVKETADEILKLLEG